MLSLVMFLSSSLGEDGLECPAALSCFSLGLSQTCPATGRLTVFHSWRPLATPSQEQCCKKKKRGDVREKGGNKVFGKQRVLQPQVLWKQFRNNLLPAQLLSAPPAVYPVWPPGCSLPKSQPPPSPSRSLMAESW